MIRSKGNRLPRILITVFTAFVIMGSLCLGAVGLLQAAELGIRGTGGVDGMVDNFIPSPAEEPVLVMKTEDQQFTPQRTGAQRIFNSCGTHGPAFAFYQPWFGINSLFNCIDIKNTILLKLRI
jgi:hypothetical protein